MQTPTPDVSSWRAWTARVKWTVRSDYNCTFTETLGPPGQPGEPGRSGPPGKPADPCPGFNEGCIKCPPGPPGPKGEKNLNQDRALRFGGHQPPFCS